MAKLDKQFAPYVQAAKQAYISEYEQMPEGMKRKKKPESKISHFDYLSQYYAGRTMREIADELGFNHESTARNTLGEAQNRVRLFILETCH